MNERRVLIVDRDADVARVVAEALAQPSASRPMVACVAANGAEALDEFNRQAPDAAYVDLGLSGLSGLELVDLLRDPRRPRVPIVVSAGPHELELIASALAAGADDFVVRPIDVDGLVLRLRARSAPGLRSANFTPLSLNSVDDTTKSRPRTYCADCTTISDVDGNFCRHCSARRPADGWPPLESSGLPYLGAVLAGRYLLNRFIDRGTAGDVYRALDLFLKRYYAVKVVELSGDAGQLRGTVEREATAVARLQSPHVVNIYEVHELPGDRLLVVMDFVDGCTLSTLVSRSGPLPPPVALDIARQAAQGLHEVHELGMVHRDIKPSNLMVQQLPAAGRFVRILDFGLVRLRGTLNRRTDVYGTPRYAAPEQLLRDRTVDRRADVYSLGLLLYFMLSGASPSGEILEQIVADRLAGAVKNLEAYADRLPGAADLLPLVGSMTAPDPELRPQDMADVVRRIDALAGGRMDTAGWSTV